MMFVLKLVIIYMFLIKSYRTINCVCIKNGISETSDFDSKLNKVECDKNQINLKNGTWFDCVKLSAINSLTILAGLNNKVIRRSSKSVYNHKTKFYEKPASKQTTGNILKHKRRKISLNPNIDVAIFVDEMENSSNDFNNKILHTMVINFMKRVQEIFHHPSLGTKINITITHIEMIESHSKKIPHYSGNADLILDSFCDYQNVNVTTKTWDLGIYLTSIDLNRVEYDEILDIIGLANVDSICSEHACAIVELGSAVAEADSDNIFDSLRPSHVSTYTAAHEIGHV